MKNCSEKQQMVCRFDGEIAVVVAYSRKDVTDSEDWPFLTSFKCRRDVQRGDGGAFPEMVKRNQTHGFEKAGVIFDEARRQR